jgi:putative ABC transport system ATP-binding protein
VPAICATGINKSYTVGRITTKVLFDVSIELEPGEFALLAGPSGCGKSSLLAVLSGLSRPDSGSVKCLDTDLWSLSDRQRDAFRLQHVGFVFQGFNLFSALTATEQVAYLLERLGRSNRQARAEAISALEAVGLSDRLHLRPRELSGGEKQRVSIARALAKRPKLLFADEPTSALDSMNGENVVALIKEIAARDGTSVLCVTHDQRVTRHAKRILNMEDGRVTDQTLPSTQSLSRLDHVL